MASTMTSSCISLIMTATCAMAALGSSSTVKWSWNSPSIESSRTSARCRSFSSGREMPMRTLVVGGTGGIGGYVAHALRAERHEGTLAPRHPPSAGSQPADFPILLGTYSDADFTREQLGQFDNIVFAACNDPRQLPPGST